MHDDNNNDDGNVTTTTLLSAAIGTKMFGHVEIVKGTGSQVEVIWMKRQEQPGFFCLAVLRFYTLCNRVLGRQHLYVLGCLGSLGSLRYSYVLSHTHQSRGCWQQAGQATPSKLHFMDKSGITHQALRESRVQRGNSDKKPKLGLMCFDLQGQGGDITRWRWNARTPGGLKRVLASLLVQVGPA